MGLRVAVYNRKSSKDGDDNQKNSLIRQAEDTERYFERQARAEDDPSRRLKYDSEKDLYKEDASAKYPGRKRFNEMVQEIKKHKYDVLFCTDLSRLSRNVIDNAVIVQLLEEGHLKEVRTLDKTFSTSPTDKFTLNLFLAVSKYENDQRALNTVSGMNSRRSAGATTFRPVMGYRNEGTQKGNKTVVRDGENFMNVRSLWTLFLSGNWTIEALHDKAEELGITVLRKGKRTVPSVSAMRGALRNHYYLGLLPSKDKNGQETFLRGNHEAMVSQDEFDEVQNILQRQGYNHAKINRAPDLPGIIRGISVSGIYKIKDKDGRVRPAPIVYEKKVRYTCAHCHHRYISNQPKNCTQCNTPMSESTKISTIEHISHYTATGGKVHTRKFSVVEEFLKAELEKIVITDAMYLLLRRRFYTLWLEKEKKIAAKCKDLESELRKLRDEKRSVCRKQMSGEKDSEKSVLALEDIENDKEVVEGKLKKLTDEYESTFERDWQKLQVLKDAKEILNPKTDFEPKKRLILSLISNLVFYKDSIEIEWKEPFGRLVKTGVVKNMACAIEDGSVSSNFTGSP